MTKLTKKLETRILTAVETGLERRGLCFDTPRDRGNDADCLLTFLVRALGRRQPAQRYDLFAYRHSLVAQVLGLDHDDVSALEGGYEDWSTSLFNYRELNPALYDLGVRIRVQYAEISG